MRRPCIQRERRISCSATPWSRLLTRSTVPAQQAPVHLSGLEQIVRVDCEQIVRVDCEQIVKVGQKMEGENLQSSEDENEIQGQ